MENLEEQKNLAKFFENLFQASSIGEAEAETLRVATQYTIFLDGQKIRALTLLYLYSKITDDEEEKKLIEAFLEKYLEFQRYNQAQKFIVKVLESLTLKRYLGENWLKVEVQK
jgi:uncharacterized protein YacL (UPF0231 family)